jgi:hypothetical protein
MQGRKEKGRKGGREEGTHRLERKKELLKEGRVKF